MLARAIVQLPDGSVTELVPGSLVGRTRRCEVFVDDGRLSEAHALCSLRGGALLLLPLRGRLWLDGAVREAIELAPGQHVELAPGLAVVVLEVVLPEHVLAIRWASEPEVALTGTTTLLGGDAATWRAGWHQHGVAWLWNDGGNWRLQCAGDKPRALEPGQDVTVGGHVLSARLRPLVDAAVDETAAPAVEGPLTIVAKMQSVHLLRPGSPPVVLDGAPAQCISELVAFNGPVTWDVCARELWRDATSQTLLRGRWDAMLLRLRRRLRQARIRDSLVRCDRQGNVELVLHPGDRVVDAL